MPLRNQDHMNNKLQAWCDAHHTKGRTQVSPVLETPVILSSVLDAKFWITLGAIVIMLWTLCERFPNAVKGTDEVRAVSHTTCPKDECAQVRQDLEGLKKKLKDSETWLEEYIRKYEAGEKTLEEITRAYGSRGKELEECEQKLTFTKNALAEWKQKLEASDKALAEQIELVEKVDKAEVRENQPFNARSP
ncbi:hypothetical protein EJ04DRAFT_553360, partial [Polyplosphaeria fusca]